MKYQETHINVHIPLNIFSYFCICYYVCALCFIDTHKANNNNINKVLF